MARRPHRIMVVEPDPTLVEIIVGSLSERFDAHITCAADAQTCLDADIVDPHELFIVERDLDDMDGLRLTSQLLSLGRRPVVVLADSPATDDAIEALRIGAADFFPKPFAVEDLLETVERLSHSQDMRRQHSARYHRMRELVRHVIRERRDLNKRMELICKDLVEAHKRLVNRVAAIQQ